MAGGNRPSRALLLGLAPLVLGVIVGVPIGRSFAPQESAPREQLPIAPGWYDEIERVVVPSLTGMGVDEATETLQSLGLRPVVVGVGPRVAKKRPAVSVLDLVPVPGTVVLEGTAITMFAF